MADPREACCQDEENLEQVEVMGSGDTVTVVYECAECGRKHYRASAMPKSFGVAGSDI